MKILVTGGAGFIGSAVVRHTIEQTTHTVINLDTLTYAGNLESVASASASDRYHFVQADIAEWHSPYSVAKFAKPFGHIQS